MVMQRAEWEGFLSVKSPQCNTMIALFSILVDNFLTVHVRVDDETPGHTMIGATRNLVLKAGQVVTIQQYASQVYGGWAGHLGMQSWFTGNLLYAD